MPGNEYQVWLNAHAPDSPTYATLNVNKGQMVKMIRNDTVKLDTYSTVMFNKYDISSLCRALRTNRTINHVRICAIHSQIDTGAYILDVLSCFQNNANIITLNIELSLCVESMRIMFETISKMMLKKLTFIINLVDARILDPILQITSLQHLKIMFKTCMDHNFVDFIAKTIKSIPKLILPTELPSGSMVSISEAIAKSTQIESLRLTFGVEDDILCLGQALGANTSLRFLHLEFGYEVVLDSFFDLMASNKSLIHVKLEALSIEDASKVADLLRKNTTLERLELEFYSKDTLMSSSLIDAIGHSSLIGLSLRYVCEKNARSTANHLLRSLTHNTNLEELTYYLGNQGVADAKSTTELLTHNQTLRKLMCPEPSDELSHKQKRAILEANQTLLEADSDYDFLYMLAKRNKHNEKERFGTLVQLLLPYC